MAPDENVPAGAGPAADDEHKHPETIGKCRIISKIGQGGMGVVYKGKHTDLDIDVAVKVLPPHLADRSDMAGRFLREARLDVRINHPEVVRVLDCGQEAGRHYLVMEFVDGKSLQDQIDETGPVAAGRALEITLAVARALDAAQDQVGIIHRDIKPDNIMLTSDGHVKVADLGLAKVVADQAEATMSGATASGVAMGTPYYMAPEQFMDARSVDLRADVFALGATLYHMLAGQRPFDGDSIYAILRSIEQTEPPPLSPSTPEPMKRLVSKMLAKQAENRYQSYAELIADIRNVQAAVEAGGLSGTFIGLAELPAGAQATRQRPTTATGEKPKAGTHATVPQEKLGGLTMSLYDVAAEKKRTVVETMKGNLGLWIGGGVALAVIIAALVAWAVIAGRKERERLAAVAMQEEADRKAAEAAAQNAADAAKAFYEALLAKIEEGKLAEAQRALDEGKGEHDGTPFAANMDELADMIVAKIKERKEALDGAVATADAKEKEGEYAEAIKELKKALALEDIPGLRERLADLERKLAALKLEKSAGELFNKGDWKGALGRYEAALEDADERRKAGIRQRIGQARERLRVAEAVAAAERAAKAGNWRAVYDGVEKARADGITSPRLEEFSREARRRLAPKETLTGPLGMEFVYLRGGTFKMGSASGEDDERPVRDVTVSSFYIGSCEVAAAEFEAFRRGLKAKPRAGGAAAAVPAASVSWLEAVQFCRYLSSIDEERATYRLAREAEWEFAARGTVGRTYPWGERRLGPEHANIAGGADGHEKAAPVGSFKSGATPEGVLDLAGNVAEWCADWYGPYPAAAETDPIGPMNGTQRVVRGGAFTLDENWARGAARGCRAPAKGAYVIGFRVVRDLTDEERMFEPAAR
jgi:formylglycine-generating enzyme required for sulfatase activity/predicted Ser/Thr protein kinase